MPTSSPLVGALPEAHWSYFDILVRLALALSLGLLIGLERERRRKEAGLRTFGFICLLGGMGGALGGAYGMVVLALVTVLAVVLNVQSLRANQGAELTTSAAMLVTCMAGILCGLGHTVAPAAVMVSATALLAWKERLSDFSMGLTEGELRSALLLAILAIVIYPALPKGSVGPFNLIEPRAAWVTVILIAGIGFFNYILWKIYGHRGAEIAGFFGGLVNSNFTVIELAGRVRDGAERFAPTAYRGILLATTAMLARNATLLLLLAPLALLHSLAAFVFMLGCSGLLVLLSFRRRPGLTEEPPDGLKLSLPFSMPVALKYGFIFLLLHVVGSLSKRYFGDTGFYVVSLIGGFMSSASAVAAAATLAAQGQLPAQIAGNGAVIASFTSLAFSLSFVLRSRSPKLVGRLGLAMVLIAAAGLLGILLSDELRPLVIEWLHLPEGTLRWGEPPLSFKLN